MGHGDLTRLDPICMTDTTTNPTQVHRDSMRDSTRMHDLDPVTDVKTENAKTHVIQDCLMAPSFSSHKPVTEYPSLMRRRMYGTAWKPCVHAVQSGDAPGKAFQAKSTGVCIYR